MSAAYWLRGDTRSVLAEMGAAGIAVDLVVSSPPFLNLRSYLPNDDPAKAQEIGSEPGPGEFIDVLLDVTEACDAALAPHGSLCWELGDTYAGSGGAGGDYNTGGLRDGQQGFAGSARAQRARPDGWPCDKSLSLIPEMYRVALAYGFNPLTGRVTPRWRVRNVVRWVRPNPPVGALGDKYRPATSDIVVACRTDEDGRRRYWDGEAARVPASGNTNARLAKGVESRPNTGTKAGSDPHDHRDTLAVAQDTGSAPLLDWWKIAPTGYPGSHYATYPPQLVEPLVKAMCPQRVCTVCGEPSRRIVGGTEYVDAKGRKVPAQKWASRLAEGKAAHTFKPDGGITAVRLEGGWTDCGCSPDGSHWRPGIVLDPFAGSGTTLAVATGYGAIAIAIDLDERNIELARQRVGCMFFHEVTVTELAEALGVTRPAAA